MTFKEKVYERCVYLLNEKILSLRKVLDDLKESASNETKSTAGDKHETALAMLQIEQKNIGIQLDHLLNQQNSLYRMASPHHHSTVMQGSLVKTNRGYFYLSIPLGKFEVDGVPITAISLQSPLGSQLIRSVTSQSLTINGATYTIESIQ